MSGTSDDESHAVQRKLLAASAKNFAAMLDRQADAHPNRIAFLTPSGPDDEPNTWLPMTFAEFRRQAHEVAAGLMEFGLPREGRVALLSGTRTEWIIACLLYTSDAADDLPEFRARRGQLYPGRLTLVHPFRRLDGPSRQDPRTPRSRRGGTSHH